jgi:copper homeostasis protein
LRGQATYHEMMGAMSTLLEVIALHPADAEAAQEGGLCPRVSVVSQIRRSTDLPIRVMLRLSDSYTVTGAELARLQGLAQSYLAAGANGFVLGFLTPDNEIDTETCAVLAGSFAGTPWTFHRAVDAVLEARPAWQALRTLRGLDGVLTAGSVLGVPTGLDELCRRAAADAAVARLTMAGGGLRPEHVPWLLGSGIRRFHVGSSVRPDGSWTKAYVDAGFVRAWRNLLDGEEDRLARGAAAGA